MAEESPKTRHPSMSDVARLAGVSQTAVSFVLNDTPGSNIPPETRERVWAAVRELDYRPNVSARNLRTQTTNLVGLGIEDQGSFTFHPILDRFLFSTILSLEKAGYHLLSFVIEQRTDTAIYRDLYRRGQVSGFVLSNTTDNDPRIAYLIDKKIPFASFGRSNEDWRFPWVDVDGVSGMEQVVAHLAERGHRRIGLITWPEGSKAGSHRETGYLNGLAAIGIAPHPDWLFRGENSLQTGAAGVNYFLSLPIDRRPTAIACVSDLIAASAINAAVTRGYMVGRDLAITGYDDSDLAEYLQPSLTSVRQPITEVGREIVRLLLAQFNQEGRFENGVLLKPRLVIRHSSEAQVTSTPPPEERPK